MAYKYLMILIATCTTVVYFIPYACNDFYNHFIDTYHITYGQAGDLLTFFGITAVIGSVLTGATIGLADATYEDNMPQITASATATGVTVMEDTGEVRTNGFRACFIDPFQGQKMADYAVEKLGAKTAAIFYETGSDYSEGLKNAFVVEAERMGLEIVDTEAFATGDKDFKALLPRPPTLSSARSITVRLVLLSRLPVRQAAPPPSSAVTASAPSRIMLLQKNSKAASTALATRPAPKTLHSSKRTTVRPSAWKKSPICLRLLLTMHP